VVDTQLPTSDEVVAAVLRASRALVGVSARSLATVDEELTLPQFRCLVVLRTRGPVNLNALADALGVAASSAMRVFDRLVAAGLAERRVNDENRREVVLTVSPAGRTLVDAVTRRRRREVARILDRMPAERRTALADAFAAFGDAAGEPEVDAVDW
jgi:DNA-binding MarR family transcriptional regulator